MRNMREWGNLVETKKQIGWEKSKEEKEDKKGEYPASYHGSTTFGIFSSR